METEAYRLGRLAYEAYCNTTNWKSVISGADLPQFDQCPEAVKIGWIAAADAVNNEVSEYRTL